MKKIVMSIALLSSICHANSDVMQEEVATQCTENQTTQSVALSDYLNAVLENCITKMSESMQPATKSVAMQDHTELMQQMLQKNLTAQEMELLDALVAHGSIDRVFQSLQEALDVIGGDVKKSMIDSGEIQEEETISFSVSCGLTTSK